MKPRIQSIWALSSELRPYHWPLSNAPSHPVFNWLKPSTITAPPRCVSRTFTTSSARTSWLVPKRGHSDKNTKGYPRVATGGSMRGTTVVWGHYGLRLKDHERRITSGQLQIGVDAIKKRLRGEKFRLYTRVAANIGVYTSGNEMRMGKGKGKFDHWAARVAVSQIIFELKGDCHEQVIRDALRLAGNKMPGTYEFVKKGDPPVMGITKMTEGFSLADMQRPRMKLPADVTPERLPSSTPTIRPGLASTAPSMMSPSPP